MGDVTTTMSKDDTAAAPTTAPGLVLVHAEPLGSAPRALVLRAKSALIGREPPPGGFTIAQRAVSRVHASLTRGRGDAVVLRDQGSRNGTFVGGERITERALGDGDLVRLGDALFKFVASEADAHAPFALEGPSVDGSSTFGLVGGLAMARVAHAVRALAPSDTTALVLGETGVGKEMVAHALHAASGRRGRLAAVNCAAIPASLIESELFGHERGAFTGASRDREGLVRSARGGTLFLDEIGDMPLDAQAKLLRVLEAREVLPLGATRPVAIDVRVVCATNGDLRAQVREGRFRADLYARIAQRPIVLPPLRARKEDLYPLVRHFAKRKGAGAPPSLGFMLLVAQHDFPFNMRELAGAVEHACDMAGGAELRAAHLPDALREAPPPPDLLAASSPRPKRKSPSEAELRALLAREHGNVSAVARALARDPAQIYRWIQQFEVDLAEFR